MATRVAACEVREGAVPITPVFAWKWARHGVTAGLRAVGPMKGTVGGVLRCPPTHEGTQAGCAMAAGGLAPRPRPPGGGGQSRDAEFCLGRVLAPQGASVGQKIKPWVSGPTHIRPGATLRVDGCQRSHTVCRDLTQAPLRPAWEGLCRQACGWRRPSSGFEQVHLRPGVVPQSLLSLDVAVAPALQDHLREGEGTQRHKVWVYGVLGVTEAGGGLNGACT